MGPLNLFASYDVAAAHPEVLQALAKDGHVLGTETAAGPFTPLLSAYQEVRSYRRHAAHSRRDGRLSRQQQQQQRREPTLRPLPSFRPHP